MTVIVSSRARKQTGSSKATVLQEAKYPLECNRKGAPIKSPKDTASAQAKAYDPDGLHPMSSSVCAGASCATSVCLSKHRDILRL